MTETPINYIYGELNTLVEKQLYRGKETRTAITNVNNVDYTISVDIKPDNPIFDDKIRRAIANLDLDDHEIAHSYVTEVKQVNGQISVKRSTLKLSDIVGLDNILNSKQDNLYFAGSDNPRYSYSETNPVVTRLYLEDAVSELSGAMHYIGISSTDPKLGTVVVRGKTIIPVTGDVVIYDKDAYIYYSAKWNIFINESKFLFKNNEQVTNNDVADGALNMSKVDGLRYKLSAIDTKIFNAEENININTQAIIQHSSNIEKLTADLNYTDNKVTTLDNSLSTVAKSGSYNDLDYTPTFEYDEDENSFVINLF